MARISLLRIVLLGLAWGSSFLWIKIALNGLSPVQITLGRLGLGAAFLLVLCAVTRLRLPSAPAVWGHLLVVSLVANALPFALFGYGELTVDSGLAGVLNATVPLWTLLLALLTRQERWPSAARLLGLGLGFGGTLLILAPWQAGGTLIGALACAGAAICYGVSLVYTARFVVNRGLPPAGVAAVQITLATGWTLLATPFLGLQPVRLDPLIVLSIAVLGLVGSGYAFVLVNRLVADEGPTSASTVTYLLPVIAVLLGAVTLGEQLPLRVLAGMVIVLIGVMLSQRNPRAVPPGAVDAAPVDTGALAAERR